LPLRTSPTLSTMDPNMLANDREEVNDTMTR
jgi:hypothetical protein